MRLREFRPALAIAAAVLVTAGCAGRRPAVIWSPAPVTQTIEPNGFRVITMSFVSDTTLDAVALDVSPPLRPYVTVDPSSPANVESGVARPVRLLVAMPVSATPGRTFVGLVQMRAARRALAPAELELLVGASTPEGTLQSLRAAIMARDAAAYVRQFVPERQAGAQDAFEHLADSALDRLAEALQSPERVFLSDDGVTAEYKMVVRLDPNRTETTIRLRRSGSDGIWRVAQF